MATCWTALRLAGAIDQQELRDLRILIIETSAAVRNQLKYAFGEAEGCNVVGVAISGDEGIEQAPTLKADMIRFDFFLPYSESMEVL
jgi:DNA-binding NarL/FixJ family response regulator